MSVTRTEVLSAYRYLLRSIAIAFPGDHELLTAARTEARTRFDKARNLAADSNEAVEGVKHCRDVGLFLRRNVVQGVKDEDSDRYRLRVHEETERGDNLSIKDPPPIPVSKGTSRRKPTQLP